MSRLILALSGLFVITLLLAPPVVAKDVRILFDETRLHKREAGSYTEGAGYEFAIGETAWYGASTFAKLLREKGYVVEVLSNRPITSEALTDVDVFLILEPGSPPGRPFHPYTSAEVAAIRTFVTQGGGLFLACREWRGESSRGADVVARIFGVSFKDNGIICDPKDYESEQDEVKVQTLHDHPITQGVSAYFFQGTYLDELGKAFVLAESDADSWFDRFGSDDWGDQKKQPTESTGPFPVLAAMEYGAGRIVSAGDAFSLVSNAWIDELDAERLALNIVEWLAFLDRKPPVASFSVAPTRPWPGLYTTFDASASTDSLGTITKYAWNFGDGSTGEGKHVSHVYDRPGTYTIVLTVTDNDGMTASTTQRVEVISPSPIAYFTFSPAAPSVFEEVQFRDTSTDADGEVVSWQWEFGDGTTSTERNPTHSYKEAGTFFVTLIVTDTENLKDRIAKWIVVKPRDLIQANFTFRVIDETFHKYHLDASTSVDTMGKIVRYEWDWDSDGTYDTAVEVPEIKHRFPEDGPYQVTLTIVDDHGNRASCTKEVSS